MKRAAFIILASVFLLFGGLCGCSDTRCESGGIRCLSAHGSFIGEKNGLSEYELFFENSGGRSFVINVSAWFGEKLCCALNEDGTCCAAVLPAHSVTRVTCCFRVENSGERLPQTVIIGGRWLSSQ